VRLLPLPFVHSAVAAARVAWLKATAGGSSSDGGTVVPAARVERVSPLTL